MSNRQSPSHPRRKKDGYNNRDVVENRRDDNPWFRDPSSTASTSAPTNPSQRSRSDYDGWRDSSRVDADDVGLPLARVVETGSSGVRGGRHYNSPYYQNGSHPRREQSSSGRNSDGYDPSFDGKRSHGQHGGGPPMNDHYSQRQRLNEYDQRRYEGRRDSHRSSGQQNAELLDYSLDPAPFSTPDQDDMSIPLPPNKKRQHGTEKEELNESESIEMVEQVVLDEEAILAERRRKRIEIAAKYSSSIVPITVQRDVDRVVAATEHEATTLEVFAEDEAVSLAALLRGTREEDDTIRMRVTKRTKLDQSEELNPEEDGDISTPLSHLLPPSLSSSIFPLSKSSSLLPLTASFSPAALHSTEGNDTDDEAGQEGDEVEREDQKAAQDEIAAAELDPSLLGLTGERLKQVVQVDSEQDANDQGTMEEEGATDEEGEEEEEDDDDMFAIDVSKVKVKRTKQDNVAKTLKATSAPALPHNPLLQDNFDDADGYYNVLLGETLDKLEASPSAPGSIDTPTTTNVGRYKVKGHAGRGMFSCVVRAIDLAPTSSVSTTDVPIDTAKIGAGRSGENPGGVEVAIKIIRSQESMYKAAVREIAILKRIIEADPGDKKHLVRLLRTFEWRGHLCLVFEGLSLNLREVIKKFGKDVGINLHAVRAYASQMFLALSCLKKCGIVHGDLKPDNILVNESKALLKICDLGSATDISAAENEVTPYLVSRFYRAPEIILGLPYDFSLDTWSIGCTLYELYTGKILFPGRTNNHMLRLIMELKGKISHKLIKKSRYGEVHFDETMVFKSVDRANLVTLLALPSKASNDLSRRLMSTSSTKKMKEDEVKLLGQFVDLLEKMLAADKSKRWGPKELLNHAFVR